jgi:hypothetical protein
MQTKNIPDNTLVSYSISGVNSKVLNNSPLVGSFQVIQGKAEISIKTIKGVIDKNSIFRLILDNKKASVSVLIKAITKSTPPPGIRTDVSGCIEKIIVISPGYGYTTGDRITDGTNTYTPIISPNSGAIVDVLKLNNPICGFKEPPLLSINTRTGTGADFVPLMKYYSSYTSLDQTKLSSVGISTVIDCI